MSSSQISASTYVEAPPAVVFAIVSDPRQHPRIDGSGTVRDTVSGPDKLVLGSEFAVSMKQVAPYRTKNRVVEFEPDRLIAWRHLGLHRWRYELAPSGTGTEVSETWDLAAYPAPLRAVLRAALGKKTQAAVDSTLVKLKAAAEADAATT